jgi:hypothetical protein
MSQSYTETLRMAGQNVPPLDAIPPESSYLERLRDEAAIALAAAWIAYHGYPLSPVEAKMAFDGADAMLAERGKR